MGSRGVGLVSDLPHSALCFITGSMHQWLLFVAASVPFYEYHSYLPLLLPVDTQALVLGSHE